MISFKLNHDYDLQINSNGLLDLIDNKAQLAQKLTQRLKMFYGEWFLDTTRGVPYFGNILGERNENNIVVKLLTDEISKESEVTNVFNINSSLINRKFSYSCDILSIYGEQNFTFEGNN